MSSFVCGCQNFRKYAYRGFGIVSLNLAIYFMALKDCGPDTRITATPLLPLPNLLLNKLLAQIL